VLGPLGIDVLANLCDVLVTRALQTISLDRELRLACIRRLLQLVSLGLSRRAGCRNVLLEIRLSLLP